jgi:transposase
MRPHGSPQELERRRKRAVELLAQGLSLTEVARRVGASVSAVWRWRDAYATGGQVALAPKPVPGRPRKLDPSEHPRLWEILLEGAMAHGFANDLWTCKRIARVIRREFRVKYHPSHVWKILREAGWSCQVPERRAIQRDEEAIAHWKRYKWPAIKKSRKTWCPPRIPR